MTRPEPIIRFGAAYYPEYLPGRDVEAELELMSRAGFTVIRVGESVWSTWEPEEGRFELEWLAPVLDAAHRRGIGVILGTPTYAAPPWLQRRHPEIVADTATGRPMQWGARQEMDFTHGAFRYYAERVIRRIVGRYAAHPAVLSFQVDNEPGLRLLYNDAVFRQFVDRLRRRYGTVERLNEEWGLVYWSHRLGDWSELWRPDGNAQPQYDLAWRRFQAELVTEYIAWQADIVREIAGADALVTTCIAFDQPAVADDALAASLSVTSGNAYYAMEEALAHPSSAPRATGRDGWIVRGAWALCELADTMYSAKQAPFLVTETNAGSIGHAQLNQSPYDGQWRQAAWLLIARGARMIEYWHWNTLPFGTETFWGGVLPHDGRPGRAYREIAALGAEIAAVGREFEGAEPEFDVAVLYDSDSKFALARQAPFASATERADPDAYRRIVAAFTRGTFDAGRQLRLLRPAQFFPARGGTFTPEQAARRFPVLIAAAFSTATDADLDFLAAYVAAGGHLLLGPKSAGADEEGRARTQVRPARLSAAAGVAATEFANPAAPVPLLGVGPFAGPTGCGIDLIEALEPAGAEVLARYEHPHFGRWAALTTNAHGSGRISVLGTLPDQAFARRLLSWLAPTAVSGWRLTASATVATSRRADGSRVHVLHNWSWTPGSADASVALTDPASGAAIEAGAAIPLGPWDVRVLVDRVRSAPSIVPNEESTT